MIYVVLFLFFASLATIVLMLGRRISLIDKGEVLVLEGAKFEVPYLKEAKRIGINSAKHFEHEVLVIVVRYYMNLSNVVRHLYRETKKGFHRINTKDHPSGEKIEKIQVSKLLKMIEDYQDRIEHIKHQIREEEKNR